MNLPALYDSIHAAGRERILKGEARTDPWLDRPYEDSRTGISLLVPLSGGLPAYAGIAGRFRSCEPDQYYYPPGDLHITVFSFLTAVAGYRRDPAADSLFRDLVREVLRNWSPFTVDFRGIVFSPEAGILAGFPDAPLSELRDRFRRELASRNLKNEERYPAATSHATFLRFRRPLSRPEEFCRILDRERDTPAGGTAVTAMELVEHDWYNSERTRRVLERYSL